MIRIENVDIHGWEAAIRGMRNPKNSWHLSDSYWTYVRDHETGREVKSEFFVGNTDLTLMQSLAVSGTDDGKFLRDIDVSLDITAPLYWWKEFDTYKVGTVSNSCSTMHKIHVRDLTFDDFSHEHLDSDGCVALEHTINRINANRKVFIATEDWEAWYRMIQLLPTSYNQRRTIKLNYAVLRAMYHARKHHKLDEWRKFCEWIKTLPYAEELIINERL